MVTVTQGELCVIVNQTGGRLVLSDHVVMESLSEEASDAQRSGVEVTVLGGDSHSQLGPLLRGGQSYRVGPIKINDTVWLRMIRVLIPLVGTKRDIVGEGVLFGFYSVCHVPC